MFAHLDALMVPGHGLKPEGGKGTGGCNLQAHSRFLHSRLLHCTKEFRFDQASNEKQEPYCISSAPRHKGGQERNHSFVICGGVRKATSNHMPRLDMRTIVTSTNIARLTSSQNLIFFSPHLRYSRYSIYRLSLTMFRAQQNAFDDAIGESAILIKRQAATDRCAAKATDENLTSENWELILVSFE